MVFYGDPRGGTDEPDPPDKEVPDRRQVSVLPQSLPEDPVRGAGPRTDPAVPFPVLPDPLQHVPP